MIERKNYYTKTYRVKLTNVPPISPNFTFNVDIESIMSLLMDNLTYTFTSKYLKTYLSQLGCLIHEMHKLLNDQDIFRHDGVRSQHINQPKIDTMDLKSIAPSGDAITNIVTSNLHRGG